MTMLAGRRFACQGRAKRLEGIAMRNGIVLQPVEIGQHVLPTPSFGAEVFPLVEIAGNPRWAIMPIMLELPPMRRPWVKCRLSTGPPSPMSVPTSATSFVHENRASP